MERVERVDTRQTSSAKEPDRYAIQAAVCPFFATEFATVVSGGSPALEPNELFKEQVTFCSPE